MFYFSPQCYRRKNLLEINDVKGGTLRYYGDTVLKKEPDDDPPLAE